MAEFRHPQYYIGLIDVWPICQRDWAVLPKTDLCICG